MQIHEVMKEIAAGVAADTMVSDAAARMVKDGLEAVPVIADGKLAGLLTERNIVEKVVAAGRSPKEVSAGEIMDRDPATCGGGETLEDIVGRMREQHAHFMVVTEDGNIPRGIVTLRDIAAHASVNIAISTLEKVLADVHAE